MNPTHPIIRTSRPTVRGDNLTYHAADGELVTIPLAADAWERWLTDHKSFRYDDHLGGLTVRKEPRHGYFYKRRSEPDGYMVKRRKPTSDPRLIFVKKMTWYYWYGFRTLLHIGTVKVYVGAKPDPARLAQASQRAVELLEKKRG